MNFHKKIGFLAALLLTFGLGVPDGFAQTVSNVTLTLTPNSVTDTDAATTVTARVSVTLSAAATTNKAVTVTLSNITDPDGTGTPLVTTPAKDPAETGDYALDFNVVDSGQQDDIAVVVRFASGETTRTEQHNVSIDPNTDTDDDDTDVVRIRARHTYGPENNTTDVDDTADLTIKEFVSSVNLTLSPDSLVDTDGATTVTAEVSVTLSSNVTAATSVVVNLTNDTDNVPAAVRADDFTLAGLETPVTVNIAADSKSGKATGTFTLDPGVDTDDDNDEKVRIKATVNQDQHDDTADLTITEFVSSVALTLSPDRFEEDSGMVSVLAEATVNVSSAPSAATVLTVNLSNITRAADPSADPPVTSIPAKDPAEAADYNMPDDDDLPSIQVTISSGSTTGTGRALFNFQPVSDNDNDSENVMIQAATAGHNGTDMLTISEGEIESIALVLDAGDGKTSVSEGDAKTIVTGTVTVTLNSSLAEDTSVSLTVTLSDNTSAVPADSRAESGDYTLDLDLTQDDDRITQTVVVTVLAEQSSGTGEATVTLDPHHDADVQDETVQIKAMSGGQSTTANLTITDDDDSKGQIAIATNVSSIAEGASYRDVIVTATLPSAPGTAIPVVVTATLGDDTLDKGTVSIAAGDRSGTVTLSIDVPEDEVYEPQEITVTGSSSAYGYESGTSMISVVDSTVPEGTITITANPPSITQGTSSPSTTLTVKAVLNDIKEATGSVNVVLSSTAGNLAATPVTVTISMKKNPDKDPTTVKAEGKDTVVLSGFSADNLGSVTVTGKATGYATGKVTIPILDRDASHIDGFRIAIVFPDSGKWVGVGDKKVDVEVTRINGVAHPWSSFQKIEVTLKGGLPVIPANAGSGIVYQKLSAQEFNISGDGKVSFKKVGTKGAIAHNSAKDALKFELQITPWAGDDSEHRYGQYSGVYANVEFTREGYVDNLDNTMTTRPVYTDLGALDGIVDNESDKYVGDGTRIRIDNKQPFRPITKNNIEPTDIKQKVTGLDVRRGGAYGDAKIGDVIRVAVRADRDGLFWNGARIRLNSVANSEDYALAKGKTLHTATYSLSDVTHADDSDDSLRVYWEVKEGAYKVQLSDFLSGVGQVNTNYQPNNLMVKVLVDVKDQAGNYSPAVSSSSFRLDAQRPGITVLYPSADYASFTHTRSTYFTGANTATRSPNEKYLNPLRILSDERLMSLKVFAVGSDTLDLTAQLPTYGTKKPFRIYRDSTSTYNTEKLTRAKGKLTGQGGSKIDLAILATDLVGNLTKVVVPGVTHDAKVPELKEWFPKNSLVEDNQINEDTRHPVVRLPEKLDSLSVTYSTTGTQDDALQVVKDGDSRLSVTDESVQFLIGKDFVANKLYTMQIFTRDYAGNVSTTPADSSYNLRFNPNFQNPKADGFKVSAKHDSVIAGQANALTIQAVDTKKSRNVVVYDNRDADGTKAAEVRITAMDAAGMPVNSVWFHGNGVTDDDHTDGMASLDTKWTLGKRTVYAKSKKTVDYMKVVVEHRNAGTGATSVVKFDGSVDSLTVDAGAFAMFTLEAFEDDSGDEPVDEVWGDFELTVTPTDEYGNPSLKSYVAHAPKDDSLRVLDTRVGEDGTKRYDDVFVFFSSSFTLEGFSGLALVPVNEGGFTFTPEAPNKPGRKLQITARVDAASLDAADKRRTVRGSLSLTITQSLSPELTLWIPGMEGDQAGNDVSIPADEGMITVTVAAEGYNPGDMVTFTKGDTAMDPTEADDDGVARLAITMNAAGSVTVSAVRADGRYETDALTITFVEAPPEPDRKSYVDANNDPVYLIYTGDAPPDMTVGTDDFLALVAAFGSSKGDDNYNAQADVDDDGDVDVDDYLEFIKSYGRTAAGPATKPLVLLPGINENAEFSLSLGSERVVAGELVAVDVSLANVEALTGYGFALNYETDKFEFVSAAPADEDLLKSTGGETLFHHVVADGQITVANGLYNGTAISGGGDVVRFVFRVLREFEDNARFEIADGLVFDPSQLQNPAVVAGVLELQSTPREFALHQNFPNPFNPDTTIKYDLAESADVTLQIYNVLGQVVRTLVASEAQNAGRYQIRWNGMDDRGVPVSSGIYFYQISADGKFSDVRKLMLLK